MRATLHARPGGLGALDIQSLLRNVADVAGQVSDTARAASGATPAVSIFYRYRWPLAIGGSLLAGVLLTRALRSGRRR
jgi:hypothetical protein